MGLRRSLEDWAVPWACFLASPTHVHVALLSLVPSWHINDAAGPTLFPGVIPIVLAAAALTVRNRRVRRDGRAAGTMWNRIAMLCDVAVLAGAGIGALIALTGLRRIDIGGTVVTIRQVWRPWLFAAIAVAARVAILPESAFQYIPGDTPLDGCVRALADRRRR